MAVVDLSMQAIARRSLERSIGNGWRRRERPPDWPLEHAVDLIHVPSRLTVIASTAHWPDEFGDAHEWTHASVAHPHRDPSYDELKALHAAVFGDRYAYQVFAPPARHVDIHAHALHLWGRADGANALPDFGFLGTI